MASRELSPQGLAMYELMLKDTAFIKRQQWATTNYTALIYAAIIWVVHNLSVSEKQNCVLMLLVIATGSISIGILIKFQCELGKLRKRIAHANNTFLGSRTKSKDFKLGSPTRTHIPGDGIYWSH